MADNELVQKLESSSSTDELDACPHCGALSGTFQAAEPAVESAGASAGVPASEAAATSAAIKAVDMSMMAALASSAGSLPQPSTGTAEGDSLTKWEQDTFRDIISNVNNTLRFQIQMAVPILAGCVTALNLVPPQEHQEFLNNYDRWVFFPVLLSMGVAYYGLELHWGLEKGKPTDNHEVLGKLVKRKYFLMHMAICLQALGLVLLFLFVLLEFK